MATLTKALDSLLLLMEAYSSWLLNSLPTAIQLPYVYSWPVCFALGSAAAGPSHCNQRCRPGPGGLHAPRFQLDCWQTLSAQSFAPSTLHARWTTPSHLEKDEEGKGRDKLSTKFNSMITHSSYLIAIPYLLSPIQICRFCSMATFGLIFSHLYLPLFWFWLSSRLLSSSFRS